MKSKNTCDNKSQRSRDIQLRLAQQPIYTYGRYPQQKDVKLVEWRGVVSMDRFLQKQSCSHNWTVIGKTGVMPLLEHAHYIMEPRKGFLILDNDKIIINKIKLERRIINVQDYQE